MKIGGVEITGNLAKLNEDVLVLPRKEGHIVFTARAIPTLEEFDEKVPRPKPAKAFHKGKGWIENLDDPTYKQQVEQWGKLRVAYFVVKSLEPSDIEWSTVDLDKIGTWVNWENDFKKVGFTQHECELILGLCMDVNQLNERALEKAREAFVRGQEMFDESSFQSSEQSNSQSGEPVNPGE